MVRRIGHIASTITSAETMDCWTWQSPAQNFHTPFPNHAAKMEQLLKCATHHEKAFSPPTSSLLLTDP